MSDEAIEKYRHDLEIIRLTSEQIQKDFDIFGYEIKFSGNAFTAYDELKQQIAPILFNLYENKRNTFQSLLYRVDISEKQLLKLISSTNKENFSARLAEMIITREFQKVLTRKFFSEGRADS